jgi:hypothetical protein
VTATTSYNDNEKEAEGSNEEYVTATKRDFKSQAWQLNEHFEKLLKLACSNHPYPVKHKLKECTMMRNFMTWGVVSKGKNPKGDSSGKGATPFPR